jgi:glycosyltransferase involved in cell wall biosynthesis
MVAWASQEQKIASMRICLVSREFPPYTLTGGIGAYTHKTVAALARLGHETHVVTAAAMPPADYEENGVSIHRIQEPDERGPLPFSVAHTRAVASAIARIPGDLDIVQACEWNGEAFWYTTSTHRRTKLVTRLATPHFVVERLNESSQPRGLRRGVVTRTLERVQTLRSDGIISPTRALASIVCDGWHIAPERVTVVPTGASLNQSAAALDAQLPGALQGERYLLYFGRLERRKGVHILGAALPTVLAHHPDLKVVFIGEDLAADGQPMAELIRQLATPYADRLTFLPRMAQGDLFPIIRAARLVTLPSLWENLANTCLEAMQLARPVIATWGCGFEEVIEDNVSGYLATPGDAPALAARILDALADEAAAERIGQAAQRRAQEFSVDAMAARLANYYERLIAAGDRSAVSA